MNLHTWITDYTAYLNAHGYAAGTGSRRLQHLQALERFAAAQGWPSLESFRPEHTPAFLESWIRYHRWAKASSGFKPNSRFQPHHHLALQHSLRSFLRWAHLTSRLPTDVFPCRAPVRGPYHFSPVADYLRFLKQHRGLAHHSLVQIELFVRRFDQFLHGQQVTEWRQIQSHPIDQFVRQQASRNIGRIQPIHKILPGLFRYLFSRQHLDRDWAAALHSPPHYRLARTPRALSAPQVLHRLESINRHQVGSHRDFAIVLRAASLGVRASQIAALRLEDLDWKQAVVRFPPVKGPHALRLPLSQPLVKAWTDYFETERPAHSPYRHVFLRRTAPQRPLHPGSVSGLMGKRLRQAGIRASGHQLRHAFASELWRAGTGFSTLQELLGHSHFSSTQVYTKIDLDQLREVADTDANHY